MTKHLSKQTGFTIVELLVVIVVIGILAAITIVSYTGITSRAAITTLKSDLKNASTKLSMNNVTDSTYPANADALPKSEGTVYAYNQTVTSYCLSATSVKSGNSTFHISSATGAIEEGDCTLKWKQIVAGGAQSCAIGANDLAYCWGYNDDGQLGNGSIDSSNVPVAVNNAGALNGKTIKSIAVTGSHACAIASDNLAYCWGTNWFGELGDNSDNPSLVPVAVNMTNGVSALYGKTVKSIVVGGDHTCAIASDDLVYCWGGNNWGQLGNNDVSGEEKHVPVAAYTAGILNGKTIKSIVAGYYNTCVIASDNLVYCWGWKYDGELGDNTIGGQSYFPVAVNMTNGISALYGKTVKSISSKGSHTCVIASDDLVYCWGDNAYGQIGDNTSGNNRLVPTAVNMANGVSDLFGKTIKSIGAGEYHACAIASDDSAYCWGEGGGGQLGLGDDIWDSSLVPKAVNKTGSLSGKTIKSISGAYYHTCAIASDDFVYCWGDGTDGQLGNGTYDYSGSPIKVSTLYW